MIAGQRSVPARIGITLLNLLAPGLGLLRLGDKRRALAAYGVTVGALAVFVAALAATPNIGFVTYAVLVVTVLAVTFAACMAAMWWTWRESRVVNEPRQAWSKWFSIVGAVLIAFAISSLLTGMSKKLYHNYYLPSEAMEPTLNKNDHILASMRMPKDLRRGEIVLVRSSTGLTYIKRLAALPGDRISVNNGIVIINGQKPVLEQAGVRRVSYPYMAATEARLYREAFPGEAGSHLIQDLGASPEDNVSELIVSPGHIFVLGDNRDDSADSRVPQSLGGLDQVPIKNVIGRPTFLYWPRDKMGVSLRAQDR